MNGPPGSSTAFRRAESLEDQVRTLIESSAFSDECVDQRDATIALVLKARQLARADQVDAALDAVNRGEAILADVTRTRRWWWRTHYVHGITILGYHVAVFGAVVYAIVKYPGYALWHSIPIFTIQLGALGAVLRGISWVGYHVAHRSLRAVFVNSHFGAPFVGALYGLLAYLLYSTGLLVLGGKSGNGSTVFPPMALAFLSGFNWQWITQQIEKVLGVSRSQ